jgi:hypothetical protein
MKLNTFFSKSLIIAFAFISFSCEYESLDTQLSEDVASGAIHAGTYKLTTMSVSSFFDFFGNTVVGFDFLDQNECLQGTTIVLLPNFTFISTTNDFEYLPYFEGDDLLFDIVCGEEVSTTGSWALVNGNTIVITYEDEDGENVNESYSLIGNKLRSVQPDFTFFYINAQGQTSIGVSQVIIELTKI